ncbi:MAG TPA: hypothetical protein VLO07_09490 [Thermoanaerobaculia bacterium]|nr:hypothetical protein [Thermoanaerobaculia bacterium]
MSGTLHPAPVHADRLFMAFQRAPAKCRTPFGLRRRGAICGVIAPRRCNRIAVVALSCI